MAGKKEMNMARIAVVYQSPHHGNTKKLLDAIHAHTPIDLIPAEAENETDLSGYDAVGFASGIYMSKMHKSLTAFVEKNQTRPASGKAFLIYTSGSGTKTGAKDLEEKLKAAGYTIIGTYETRGFDTFGPFKLIGGLNKGHPDQEDIEGAVRFFDETILTGI